MSPIGTAIRWRTTVKYRRPSTSTVLWTIVLAQLIPVPYVVLYVYFKKHRSNTGNNNNAAYPLTYQWVHCTCSLCHLLEESFDQRGVWPGWQNRGLGGASDRVTFGYKLGLLKPFFFSENRFPDCQNQFKTGSRIMTLCSMCLWGVINRNLSTGNPPVRQETNQDAVISTILYRGEVSKMPTLRKNCIYSMAFNT